jgi:hypothetical protein
MTSPETTPEQQLAEDALAVITASPRLTTAEVARAIPGYRLGTGRPAGRLIPRNKMLDALRVLESQGSVTRHTAQAMVTWAPVLKENADAG